MVTCLKINKRYGQKAKDFLIEKNWLNSSIKIGKTTNYLLFPLTKNAKKNEILNKFKGEIRERFLDKSKKAYARTLKKELRGIIPDSKIEKVKKSYDLVGDIAILEIPPSLKKLEKSIAWTLYRTHPNIKSVAKKQSAFSGKFRIRKIKNICGKNRSTTTHRESGVKLKLDLNEVYFSPRLGAERLRIANQVKPGEKILVMFSGISPYSLVIEKKQPRVEKIFAVELNIMANSFAMENIKLNRSRKVIPILGDVRRVVSHFETKFDRIIMILPKQAHTFLEEAFSVSKRGTIIHLYQFYNEKDIDTKIKKDIEKLTSKIRKVKILDIVKCGPYSPRKFRVCIDIKVL